MHTRHTLLLVALSSILFLLPTLTSADLICQSPRSLPTNTLQPGTPLTLKFTNKSPSLLSDVSANLICSSSGDSALTLATKLNSAKTSSVTLTPAQVASALKACPDNNFHVQYEEDSLLSKNTESCQGSFSLQTATKQPQNPTIDKGAPILIPPSISVPLPIPTTTVASTTGSPSTAPTVIEPQPTTTVASVPPTTATTIVTRTGVPSSIIPSNPSSGTTTLKNPRPPTPTTTTTRPPKSGGGGGEGNGNDDSQPPSSPTTTPPNGLASSDMQQSSGSGPSTATIAGISVGILAGVFVILGAMLIWRKRSQRRDLDLFLNDTLTAASGFQSGSGGASGASSAEQPIYGRSPPEDEKYEMNGGAALSRKVSSNAPRRSRSHTSNHNKSPVPTSAPPPPPMLMQPLPVATGGQDASYYQQQDSYYANQQYHQQHQPQHQQHQDYYASQHQQQQQPPKRKPSYRLPRHHPAFDYEYEHEHSYGQR